MSLDGDRVVLGGQAVTVLGSVLEAVAEPAPVVPAVPA